MDAQPLLNVAEHALDAAAPLDNGLKVRRNGAQETEASKLVGNGRGAVGK